MPEEHSRLAPLRAPEQLEPVGDKNTDTVGDTNANANVSSAPNGDYDRIWSADNLAGPTSGGGDWWREQAPNEPTNPDQQDEDGSGVFDGLFSVRAADGTEPIKPAKSRIDTTKPVNIRKTGNAPPTVNAPKRLGPKPIATKKPIDDKKSIVTKKPVDDKTRIADAKVAPIPSHASGDDYIDRGAACDSVTGDSCFLSGPQRTRLISSFQHRALAAEVAHKVALTQLRVDKLITKDEELPWIAMLTLDLIGMVFAHGLTVIFKELASTSQSAITTFLEGERTENMTRIAAQAYEQIGNLSAGQLPNQAKALVDLQKTSIAKSLSKVDVMKNKRTAEVSYIDRLTEQSSVMFQHVREKAPAGATDAALLVMWSSFDAPLHTVGVYKSELQAKLERFNKSGVKDIGRESINPFMSHETVPDHPDRGAPAAAIRDRFVVKLQFKSGATGSRHAYASKYWKRQNQADPVNLFNLGRHEIDAPQREGYDHSHKMEYYTRLYRLERLIETEFEDIAIERHALEWNAPPKTIIIDDTQARPPQGPQQHPSGPRNPFLRQEQPKPQRNPFLRDKPIGDYGVASSSRLDWEDPTTWGAGQQ